ncbi:hypothetical protein OY671_007961, partial [Metschnikowia pulcherrima]
LPMNRPARITANTITGTLEAGARGPILRDADGVAWRSHFGEEPVPDRLDGKRSSIDRSTLDSIAADAQDFSNVLNASGLHQASAMMLGVLEPSQSDRANSPEERGGAAQNPQPP